jgi:hypothetical protein
MLQYPFISVRINVVYLDAYYNFARKTGILST